MSVIHLIDTASVYGGTEPSAANLVKLACNFLQAAHTILGPLIAAGKFALAAFADAGAHRALTTSLMSIAI